MSYPTRRERVILLQEVATIISEILTAAQLKKTFVLIQRKPGELHSLTDNGDVTSEKKGDTSVDASLVPLLICILHLIGKNPAYEENNNNFSKIYIKY